MRMACFVSSGSFEMYYSKDLFQWCFAVITLCWVMPEQALENMNAMRGGLNGFVREELDMYGR